MLPRLLALRLLLWISTLTCLLHAFTVSHHASLSSRLVPLSTTSNSMPPFFGLQMSSGQEAVVEKKVGNGNKNKKDKSNKMTSVTFSAEKKLSSKPVSLSTFQNSNENSIKDFFACVQTRNLILTKDVEVTHLDVPPSSKLMKIWAMESKGFAIDPSADISQDNTCEVVLLSKNINFPGLALKNIIIMGCKLIVPEAATESKDDDDIFNMQYEFTLLDTKLEPQGNTPVVWLFRKIVGGGGETSDNELTPVEPTSSSFGIFYMEPSTSNPGDIVFTSNSMIKTKIKFPSILIKVMSLSLDKTEEEGSKSMQKTIEKEVCPALDRVVTSFLSQ